MSSIPGAKPVTIKLIHTLQNFHLTPHLFYFIFKYTVYAQCVVTFKDDASHNLKMYKKKYHFQKLVCFDLLE